jgi:hypothetical protein
MLLWIPNRKSIEITKILRIENTFLHSRIIISVIFSDIFKNDKYFYYG